MNLIYFLIETCEVMLNGATEMNGAWISGAAAIAYALQEKNVFIVATVSSTHLKMVKIRVKNEQDFDWIEAKYNRICNGVLNKRYFQRKLLPGNISHSGSIQRKSGCYL